MNKTATGVWLSAVVLMAVWLWLRLEISTDMTQFMPKAYSLQDQVLLNQLEQGQSSRLLLVLLSADDVSLLAQASQHLAKVMRDSGGFRRVENGTSLLGQAELDRLFDYRYLLSPSMDRDPFSEALMQASFQQRYAELSSSLPLTTVREVSQDPIAAFRVLLQSYAPQTSLEKVQGVWLSADHRHAVLIAETASPAYDLNAQAETLDSLEKDFFALGLRNVEMSVTGPPVFAVDARRTIERESRLFSLLATLAMLLIMAWVYRSARHIVLGALPLATAILAGITAVSMVYGKVHGITLAFGATLLGVVLDYPLHLFSHFHSGETPRQLLSRIAPTLLLGAASTSVAYLVLIWTDFQGLAQLGVFALAGIAAAWLTTVWVLPHWLSHIHRNKVSDALLSHGLKIFRATRYVWLSGALLLLVVAGWQADKDLWENDLAALSPLPQALRERDQQIRQLAGADHTRYALIVSAADRESALQKSEEVSTTLKQLIDDGQLQGFDTASRYLTSQAVQQERQERLPDMEQLRERLQQVTRNLPFQEHAFQPWLDDIEVARSMTPLRFEDFPEGVVRWRLEQLLLPVDNHWIALLPLGGVVNASALQPVLDQHQAVLLDMKDGPAQWVAHYRDTALWQLLWSLLLILLLLLLSLRSLRRSLKVMSMMLLSEAAVIAVLVLLSIKLSLFHFMALILVAGIGLDYALFLTRPVVSQQDHADSLHAVLVCAVSTMAVFGILALSQIPVLRAIGLTAALGVAFSLLMALTLSGESPAGKKQ